MVASIHTARASREHLDVARFVGALDREQLHHLAKVRMQLGDEPARNDQRRRLVLDQVRHDLDDGRRQRLVRLGFEPERAASLSALHTRNFM